MISTSAMSDLVVGYIAEYNGSTATPIAPRWALTAKHTWGFPGSRFVCRGVPNNVIDVVQHPTRDLSLIHLEHDLPGFHRPCRRPVATDGELCFMLGYGRIGSPGEQPVFPREAHGGTNVVRRWTGGGGVISTFTEPGEPGSTPNESQFVINDSGGCWLVRDAVSNTLQVVGIAISTSGTRYGDASYGEDVYNVLDWIDKVAGYPADADGDGAVSNDDLYTFLEGWHAARGDVNGDGRTTLQDIFDFLSYFHGRRVLTPTKTR